ncbi:MAG: glycosyltransferase family 4 protein [Candidatus Diapherotrites archaeon]
MRLLFVSPYIYPDGGGVGRIVLNLAKEFSRKGHNVTVVVSGNENTTTMQDGFELITTKPDFLISNTPIKFNLFFTLDRLLKKDFDLVQAFTPVPFYADIAALAARKNKIPFFLSYNTFTFRRIDKRKNLLSSIYENSLKGITLNLARKIVVYNKGLENSGFLSGFRKKLFFFSPGLDRKMFRKTNSCERHLLFVGALSKSQQWKGFNYLLEAMKLVKDEFPETKLLVAGEGNLFNHYKNYSQSLGLNGTVEFKGFLGEKELAKAYNESFFLVLPSYADAELMPFVIPEAFACGKPVVATKSGGIPYIVDDKKNGLLVEEKNSEKLAATIKKLLKNNLLRSEMGKNALKSAENFSWANAANEINEMYENELKGK